MGTQKEGLGFPRLKLTGSFTDPPMQAEMVDFANWVENLRVTVIR